MVHHLKHLFLLFHVDTPFKQCLNGVMILNCEEHFFSTPVIETIIISTEATPS